MISDIILPEKYILIIIMIIITVKILDEVAESVWDLFIVLLRKCFLNQPYDCEEQGKS